MRLLKTDTHELVEFVGDQVPGYAILSHRWTKEEVSYKEFRKGLKKDGEGYKKIIDACATARSKNHEWIWIDTCCIDKRSSAELSEAINSMYRWYEESNECLVYLFDVTKHVENDDSSAWIEQFKESDWFNRGWTLQELLAPDNITFFNASWHEFHNQTQLTVLISEITRIDKRYLIRDSSCQSQRPQNASIARRMSWASLRKTTRIEDMAYSLFGLFDVNLPLLYGEGGPKAFVRLQLEIIKKDKDESIFAWKPGFAWILGVWIPGDANYGATSDYGLLAPSPICFALAGAISDTSSRNDDEAPYYMTHRGLFFKRWLSQYTSSEHGDIFVYRPYDIGSGYENFLIVMKEIDNGDMQRYYGLSRKGRTHEIEEKLKEMKARGQKLREVFVPQAFI